MSNPFTPDYLARAAEQLGWDESPAGQQKRQEDLALLQELMAVTTAGTGPARAPVGHADSECAY